MNLPKVGDVLDYEIVAYEWSDGTCVNGFSDNFDRIVEYLIDTVGVPIRAFRSRLNGFFNQPKL